MNNFILFNYSFIQYFIILNLIITSLIPLSLNDLIYIWFIMEINNLLFIYLMNFSMKNKKIIFFYFIIQILTSLMLIFFMSINNLIILNNNKFISIYWIYFALMIKLSIPPFHFWMLIFTMASSWTTMFFLLTTQKIIPFYMLSMIHIHIFILYFIIITCSILPPIIMMNTLNFKKLLAYSSINQASWLIMLIYMKNIIWLTYFLFYSFSLYIIISKIYYFKITFNNFFNNNFSYQLNVMWLMTMMNMASLPPFSMFFMKWFNIFLIIFNSNHFLLLILMIFSSYLMLFIYINMALMSMFFFNFKVKLIMYNTNMSVNFTNLPILMISLFASMILIFL